MSFPRWPVNDPMLKDNKPLPVWQRWLSALTAQLINGVFQTLRVTGPSTPDDGSSATFTVGDSSGFSSGPGEIFAVISGGAGSDTILFIGPDATHYLALESFAGGSVISTNANPCFIEGASICLNDVTGGPVGIGITPPTAHLHIAAGSATAETAPLKLTPGTLLTVPELGAVEFTDDGADGHLYITLNVASVLTRVQIV